MIRSLPGRKNPNWSLLRIGNLPRRRFRSRRMRICRTIRRRRRRRRCSCRRSRRRQPLSAHRPDRMRARTKRRCGWRYVWRRLLRCRSNGCRRHYIRRMSRRNCPIPQRKCTRLKYPTHRSVSPRNSLPCPRMRCWNDSRPRPPKLPGPDMSHSMGRCKYRNRNCCSSQPRLLVCVLL